MNGKKKPDVLHRNRGSEVNRKKSGYSNYFDWLFMYNLNVNELMIEIKCNAEWERWRVERRSHLERQEEDLKRRLKGAQRDWDQNNTIN